MCNLWFKKGMQILEDHNSDINFLIIAICCWGFELVEPQAV